MIQLFLTIRINGIKLPILSAVVANYNKVVQLKLFIIRKKIFGGRNITKIRNILITKAIY